jgi:RNA polymerase sigma-70 factor (ECF subfamily)
MRGHRDRGLAARLIEQLPAERRPAIAAAELDALLERALETARGAWPDVALDDDAFLAHLARCLPEAPDLESIAMTDLYLACGCMHNDPRALAHFDRELLGSIGTGWSDGHRLADFADEVRQALRVRLLVGVDGEPPRIASYAGRGALATWVRIAATRLAINLRQRDQRYTGEPDDDALSLRGTELDPELEYLKTRYAAELTEALRATLRALPSRGASILRLHYQERMTVDAIGTMYRVSGRTVQRWLAEARETILDETRRLLRERVGLADSQLDSLIALVRSRLDISIYRHLDAE